MQTPIKFAVAADASSCMQTPQIHQTTPFSMELRQVLMERNLLTAKSRKKVCDLLGANSSSSPVGSDSYNELNKRVNFRQQAIEEILTSEKTYLHQLEMLMQYFVQPLKERQIINAAHHMSLFGQIEMIYNLNGELLRELEQNLNSVAQAFLKMAPFFKLYSVYAFDYRNSLFLLQELLTKNAALRKFLQDAESRPEVQRKLNSLLIVPIQRVPRYKLLLEQVLLYTSPADADYKLLKESIKQIESTVLHINSCIEDQEVTQMLINLQNSLVNRTPNIVKPSRKVIKEGVLHKLTRNGIEIKRYCVLMSDIFMYCKILKERAPNTLVENSLECCCIFPLKKLKVYQLFPGNFKLNCQGDGIIFGSNDLQLARAWINLLQDAIDLHIQCRKTLRKESSKRKPIRKKGMKRFESEQVLSPNRRKCDYESVFRHKNANSDSENDCDNNDDTGCFARSKRSKTMPSILGDLKAKPLKRLGTQTTAMQTPLRRQQNAASPGVAATSTENRTSISKFYKMITKETKSTRSILKVRNDNNTVNTSTSYNANNFSGFNSTNNNLSNSMTNAFSQLDVTNAGADLPNNQNWSTPVRKRVQFDVTEQENIYFTTTTTKAAAVKKSNASLRERIYAFLATLF